MSANSRKPALSLGERVSALCRRVRGHFTLRIPPREFGNSAARSGRNVRRVKSFWREETPHPASFVSHPLPKGEGCDLLCICGLKEDQVPPTRLACIVQETFPSLR